MKKNLIFIILYLKVFAQPQDTLSLNCDELFYKGVKMTYEEFSSHDYKLTNNIVKVTDSTPFFKLFYTLGHMDTCFNKWYIVFNEQQFEFNRKLTPPCKCGNMHLRHSIVISDTIVLENFNRLSTKKWKNDKDGLNRLKKSIVETKKSNMRKPDANELIIAIDSMSLCSNVAFLCNLLSDQTNIKKTLALLRN